MVVMEKMICIALAVFAIAVVAFYISANNELDE
jgi:hypothetical protein